MAIWVIGDVHGRLKTLEALWCRLDFDSAHDRLWMVGDLVNRGPASLGVLRWVRRRHESLGERFVCVLGNHDLHLLAAAVGQRRISKDLRPVLDAEDAGPCLDWLRHRPLLHREEGYALVHAGLWPQWTLGDAEHWARRLEELLRRGDGDLLDFKRSSPQGPDERRQQEALYAFTSLRLICPDGTPSPFKGPPEEAPDGSVPWFSTADRRWSGEAVILCGHWAALGRRLGPEVLALDSGAAWDRELTAVRLPDRQVLTQENLDVRP